MAMQKGLVYNGAWKNGLKHGMGHEVYDEKWYPEESGEYLGMYKRS